MTLPNSPAPPTSRSGPPAFNVPPVTLALAGVATAVFVALQLAGPALQNAALNWLALIPLRIAILAAAPFGPESLAAAATLVSHAILHFDLLHYAVNMGFLLAFGSAAERAMGRPRYGAVLVASAVGGALAQLAVDWGDHVVMFGASGVVSGCMGGIARLMLSGAVPAQRRTAINLIAAFLLINLLLALVGGGLMGVDADIAWEAHVGGFVAGFLVARRRPRIDMLV